MITESHPLPPGTIIKQISIHPDKSKTTHFLKILGPLRRIHHYYKTELYMARDEDLILIADRTSWLINLKKPSKYRIQTLHSLPSEYCKTTSIKVVI